MCNWFLFTLIWSCVAAEQLRTSNSCNYMNWLLRDLALQIEALGLLAFLGFYVVLIFLLLRGVLVQKPNFESIRKRADPHKNSLRNRSQQHWWDLAFPWEIQWGSPCAPLAHSALACTSNVKSTSYKKGEFCLHGFFHRQHIHMGCWIAWKWSNRQEFHILTPHNWLEQHLHRFLTVDGGRDNTLTTERARGN